MNSKNVVLGNTDKINGADSVGKQNGLYREKDGRDYFYLFNKVFSSANPSQAGLGIMAANSEVHHWVIDTLPINGFYHAKCKKCGAETDFPYEEPRSRTFTTSKKTSSPLVIRLPKRPRGRPRKALPRLEE